MSRFILAGIVGLMVLLSGCVRQTAMQVPQPPRELRAVWVATVANIDWPSKPGLSVDQQQKEMLAILDRCAELNMNAVVLQVRTSCDALYASELEPWSEYLTGAQGKAPDPFYDPLEMWVAEAHKRGIELHAWFNPYRARHGSAAKSPNAAGHIANTNPEVVRKFNGWEWLDPAEPAARKHTLAVFLDVVRRYDIDGIHIDDYFYPYPDYLQGEDFPDEPAWERYRKSGGKLSRADWRREQVNSLVRDIYRETKKARKWVKFGISPFGIWQPGYPRNVAGFNQHEKLYADARLWLAEGWCDYYTPQLYWKISAEKQPYKDLLAWWVEQNQRDRHIWPGNFTSKINDGSTSSWDSGEIIRQIEATRQQPGASGNVHFSMKALMQNRGGIADALRNGPYKDQCLVPASGWLDRRAPRSPRLTIAEGGTVTIEPRGGEPAWQWAVYVDHGSAQWHFQVLPGDRRTLTLAPQVRAVAIAAVDRCGNLSGWSIATPPASAPSVAVNPRGGHGPALP